MPSGVHRDLGWHGGYRLVVGADAEAHEECREPRSGVRTLLGWADDISGTILVTSLVARGKGRTLGDRGSN